MTSFRGFIVSDFIFRLDRVLRRGGFVGRDPDAKPPKGIVQNLTYMVWSLWSFFRTNEAVVCVSQLAYLSSANMDSRGVVCTQVYICDYCVVAASGDQV